MSPLARTLLRLTLGLAAAWLAMCALLFVFQARLLYLPDLAGRELNALPTDIGLDFEDVDFQAADGVSLHGWFVPAKAALGTVIIFHGNAGNISHRLDTLRIFNTLSLNSFIFDYRGYGQSGGRPTEAGTYLDAEAAWRHIVETRGIDADAVVLFGRSLGAAIAARQASVATPAALILESAFTSAPDLAAELYPIFPVRLLARLDYGTQGFVQNSAAPVLVIHSRDDDIVPFAHGLALLETAGDRGQLLAIRGDHNSGFLRSGQTYLQGLEAFIAQHLPVRRHPAPPP